MRQSLSARLLTGSIHGAFVVAAVLCLLPATATAWWNRAWQHRLQATCGGLNAPASTLSGFPCVIRLTAATSPPDGQAHFDYHEAQPGGRDIRLIAADDSTPLPYHIEKWDADPDNVCTAGCSEIHVQTAVAAATGTDVYLYYGAPTASDMQNAAATFSAFSAAWLMSDPSAPIRDYTANGNDCTDAVGHPTYAQTGEVDGGVYWSNAESNCGAITALNGAPQLTIALWVKYNRLNNYGFLFDKETPNGDSVSLLEGGFGIDGNNKDLKLAMYHGGPAFGRSGDILSTGTWLHVAMWYDGTQSGNANRLKLYLDGTEQPLTFTGTIPDRLPSGIADVLIGRNASGNPVDATLDEYFVATAAPPAAFIKALYDSGRGAFVRFGEPETVPTLTPTPTATPTPAPTSTPTPLVCVGDCSGDETVTVDEILTMVNIALGTAPVSRCAVGDADHSGQITVDEIVNAVNNALNGCPRSAAGGS